MSKSTIGILAPCYNEGQVIIRFLEELQAILQPVDQDFHIIIVDDGSTDNTRDLLKALDWPSQIKLDLVFLAHNKGHQGAIAQGLNYCKSLDIGHLIVMDSDGEDDPNAITELVNNLIDPIVFVSRKRRKESIKFKVFYTFYKLLFYVVTGKKLNFGNYSMINKQVLLEISDKQFVHYSAFISKLNYPKKFIPYDRRKRIDGQSKMNFDSLVLHGFKSFIEYAEDLFIVFLKLFMLIFAFILGCVGVILYKKYVLHSAILGWTSQLMLSLIIMAIISLGFFVIGIMVLYGFRKIEGQINTRLNDSTQYTVINK
jgi:glycosyltransferase involved in cell wall biosynthesis